MQFVCLKCWLNSILSTPKHKNINTRIWWGSPTNQRSNSRSSHFNPTVECRTSLWLTFIKIKIINSADSYEFHAGYLIPKGWKVMPLFRNIHHNPEYFVDPEKFNPSRFEVLETLRSILFFCFRVFIFSLFHGLFKHIADSNSTLILWQKQGLPKTQHFHAIWQWKTFLPGKWACQAGDTSLDPPSCHKIQV